MYRIQTLSLIISLFYFNSCTSQSMDDHKYTNHLIKESSPYLLQHAHNPVDWYPWGEEALKKAKDENKLMIISVGYAACHWCHVMERESFEDSTVAAVMNEKFISVKVDREERPDIDQVYMDAVQLMTGAGGWPMNVVTLPDGRPIWGGTYFPKEQWMNALTQLGDLWVKDPNQAEGYATRLTDGVRSMDEIIKVSDPSPFVQEDLTGMFDNWRNRFDRKEGGPNRSPKFPMPNNYLFLMRAAHFTGDKDIASVVDLTLEKMAFGGIYDQLGGGFARYSTDKYWKVPHFEKMMYDNGQLVSLYAEAHQQEAKPMYQRVVSETLEWVEREMTSPEGGFYSSLDADSEGEEGKFYVWTAEEIEEALDQDADWFKDYYQVTRSGNWEEHKNVLMMHTVAEKYAAAKGMELAEFFKKLDLAKAKLMKLRDRRVRPGLDDKILTSWNAIMLKGYLDAYRVFGEGTYKNIAIRNADFLLSKLRNGKGLYRNYKDGKASINAFLDDYALLIEALLALYDNTLDPKWLDTAKELADYTLEHFFNAETGMFFYTSNQDEALIARKYETSDNVIPASNSIMANNLFALAHLFDNPRYAEVSTQMLANMRENLPKYPAGYSNWGNLLLKHLYPFHEVVIAGPQAKAFSWEFNDHYLPNILRVAADKEKANQLPLLEYRFDGNATKVYVCENKVCKLPSGSVSEAVAQIKDWKK